MVANGQFREDLYYRLNVVSIDIAMLRERKEDILPLAAWFTRRFSSELKKKVDGFEADAQKPLMRYNWPGNIRELENAIERAALSQRASSFGPMTCGLVTSPTPVSATRQWRSRSRQPAFHPEEIERQALIEALKMSNWAEGCRRTALDQPARDELQDQDTGHRAPATTHGAGNRGAGLD